MATVYKRAGAKRDLVENYVYLAEHAGIETAERFLSSADESFSDLARNPGMGTALSSHGPKLTGLRKWRINGFENVLVFYIPVENLGFRPCPKVDNGSMDERDMRAWVAAWEQAGPELEAIRRQEIQRADNLKVLAILEGAFNQALRTRPPRATSGMVEMQDWFSKLPR